MDELISIIVPIYNVADYVEKCVASLVKQTYRKIEIILVDDGSTDGSGAICERLAQTDDRIQVVHKVNGGLSDARNAGIEHAKGAYYAFIDSDDYVDEHMVEALYYALLTNKAEISICGFQAVDEKGNFLSEMTSSGLMTGCYTKGYIYEESCKPYGWNYIVAWNKLYKKDLFQRIRYMKGKVHEDEFIFHYLIEQCERVAVIEDKCYYYLQRQKSITRESYTVQRMDGIEANLLRCQFFRTKKMENCFRETENIAYYFLNLAIHSLEYEIMEARLTQLQRNYRQIILSILFNRKYGIQGKLKRSLFCVNKKIFVDLCKKDKI